MKWIYDILNSDKVKLQPALYLILYIYMNHSLSPIHKYRHKRILKKWKSLAEKSSQRLNLII